jgi:exosortase/archaeosortase family protein
MSSSVTDPPRIVTQPSEVSVNKQPALGRLHVIWLILAYVLGCRVALSWWACVSQKSTGDNGIIILAAVVLLATLPTYWKTSPPLTMRYRTRGLIALISMSLLTAAAVYFHFMRIYWLGFIGMFGAFLGTCGGRDSLRHWSPFLLLSLALLPGAPAELLSVTTSWLKVATVKIAMCLTSFLIPIKASGCYFIINGTPFEIAAPCCGLQMLTAFVFLILVFQVFVRTRLCDLVLLTAAAVVTAMLFNGVRIGIAALLAYYCSPKIAMDWHTNLEYILFPAGLYLLWTLHQRLTRA